MRDALPVTGELIAVSSDTVWVSDYGYLRAISEGEARVVRVARHRFGFARSILVTTAIGAATGIALTVACTRYNAMPDEGPTDCGGLVPASLLVGALFGTVWGGFNHFSTTIRVRPVDFDALRKYSRFPQGLPDTIRVTRRVQ